MKVKTFPSKHIPSLRACECPGCGITYYVSGFKMHMMQAARKEALERVLGEKTPGKHIEFVRKNRVRKAVVQQNILDVTFTV